MDFDHRHYVPCLRWKMGEYQAVLRLSPFARNHITPLIEVPEIGFDFEKGKPSKSIADHLKSFPKRVKDKWGTAPCLVDVKHISSAGRMPGNQHPVEFACEGLRALNCVGIPVTGINRDAAHQAAIRNVLSIDGSGIGIRLEMKEAARRTVDNEIHQLLGSCSVTPGQCDLVLDLGAPSFEPLDSFTKLTVGLAKKLFALGYWRTFTVCGTAFPASMGTVRRGVELLPRHEWQLYKLLVETLSKEQERIPTFGDYAINHPDVLPVDMRLLKPAATIRYTTKKSWLIVKGENVRDNGNQQFQNHCQTIITSPYYSGRRFSYGDEYIDDCAAGKCSTGNLTTWRMVGTNHHLERVTKDLANLYGA